jgi:hypothetical protein
MTRQLTRRINVAELMAREPEPTPWRCGLIVADGYSTILSGHAGDSKTWFALCLAIGVASGSAPGGITCRKGRALYIDAENGERLLHPRLHALHAPREGLVIHESLGLDLAKPADAEWLRELVTEEQANLVVLDGLRSLAPTLIENDSDSMGPTASAIRQTARDTGAAFLTLHHRPKNGAATRGSTALRDQSDAVYVLGRKDGDPEYKIRRRLVADKMRLAAEPEPAWYTLDHHDGLTTLQAAEPHGAGDTGPSVRDRLVDQLHTYLQEHPEGATRAQLAAHVGRDRDDSTLKRALNQLDKTGQAKRPQNPGDPWQVRSPDPLTDPLTHGPSERGVSQVTPLRGD